MTFKLKDGKTEISAKDEHNSMAVRTALLIYESFNLLNTGMRTYKSAMRYNELTKEMNLLYDNLEAYRKILIQIYTAKTKGTAPSGICICRL